VRLNIHSSNKQIITTLQPACTFRRFPGITHGFYGDPTMHRILATAGVLGLVALPILASAQSTTQPTTKTETAATAGAKKSAAANTTKKSANKGSMKRQAHVANKKRHAMHGQHRTRHVTAKHGKRLAKSHGGRHGHVYGISTGKRVHRASAKSRTHARTAIRDRQTSVQQSAAYRAEAAPTQRSCGEFMYRKDGKCNDARNKPAAK
jgi:hypothetical protein